MRRGGHAKASGAELLALELQVQRLADEARAEGMSLARKLDEAGILTTGSKLRWTEAQIASSLADVLDQIPARYFKSNSIEVRTPQAMKDAVVGWMRAHAKELGK